MVVSYRHFTILAFVLKGTLTRTISFQKKQEDVKVFFLKDFSRTVAFKKVVW
ncbi:hypothetical protein SD77_0383 [Bacillus badius]|uniref:Uncharacterized protein n=1 Tax=Bacillus badius TaxID=1455 RepID=A0ABR5B0Z6_BACBA|nr:hypothetical protein SD78_3715 [Bacillus badius]KIL80535.1 hypothetical protein SD77_0383 [Bacillus badius]